MSVDYNLEPLTQSCLILVWSRLGLHIQISAFPLTIRYILGLVLTLAEIGITPKTKILEKFKLHILYPNPPRRGV